MPPIEFPDKLTDTGFSQGWTQLFEKGEEAPRDSTKWSEALQIQLHLHSAIAIARLEERVEKLERKTDKSVCLSVPINDLNNSKYRLRSPIFVLINRESEEFYAEAVDFNVYGIGGDEKEAIENFKEMLILCYENLKFSQRKLSRNLRTKLALLKKIIIDED